jgi:CheY-like chemotaxis protein
MSEEKPLILLVDDESDTLSFLFDLLHNEGFRVLPVSSAQDALSALARWKPKMVITDIRMPDMDGLELLERIKRQAPETRVLLLTAYGDWATHSEAIRKGGDGMLLKPCQNSEILSAVSRVLEEAQAG